MVAVPFWCIEHEPLRRLHRLTESPGASVLFQKSFFLGVWAGIQRLFQSLGKDESFLAYFIPCSFVACQDSWGSWLNTEVLLVSLNPDFLTSLCFGGKAEQMQTDEIYLVLQEVLLGVLVSICLMVGQVCFQKWVCSRVHFVIQIGMNCFLS